MGRNLVITTGTGSGKTEAFLIPILDGLAREAQQGTLAHGWRARPAPVPMNALANDQMERLRAYLKHFPEITLGVMWVKHLPGLPKRWTYTNKSTRARNRFKTS